MISAKVGFILFFYAFFGVNHDYHTSITEVNYNAKNKSLEISVRLFTDDLEEALTLQNKGVKITMETDKRILDPLLDVYLRRNFALISPQKEVLKMHYYGNEKEADATWVFFEILDISNIKGYTLFNTIMLELFDDQANLVNIIYQNQKKTFIFDNRKKLEIWPF
jgi:hypothetical protein